MPKAEIVKWGNSLAVRIPKAVAQEVGIKEGSSIVIEAVDGHVQMRRARRVPTLRELVAKIKPESRYGETDWGSEQGKEIVEW